MKFLNERWKRNLYSIISLEKKKDETLKKIESSIDDQAEELQLQVIDIENEIEGLKMDFKVLIAETKNDLKAMYLNKEDTQDWSLAWSGGKDSTTVAGLVIDMLNELDESERIRNIHFVMSDTMVENPNLESYMRSQVEKLKNYAEESKLPITVNLVQRPLKQSYFYLILGRGYFLPQNNGRGRWCTQRLKISPQRDKLKEIKPSYQLTGVRLSESQKRKASIKKWTKDARINKKIGGDENNTTFMVIVDFTIEDVWEYLQREKLAWSSTQEVRTLYREATGECGFTNPKGTEVKASQSESCGARFGCWTCPVILKDKSTEAMSNHNEWMKPLSDYRMMQLKVMGDYIPNKPEGQNRKARSYVIREAKRIGKEIKFITKSGHKRNGKRYEDKNGIHNDKGTVTVEARKFMFDQLMTTQKLVNESRVKAGLDTISLISQEEIDLIRGMWEEDESTSKWLITNVNNKNIDDLMRLLNELNSLEKNQPMQL